MCVLVRDDGARTRSDTEITEIWRLVVGSPAVGGEACACSPACGKRGKGVRLEIR